MNKIEISSLNSINLTIDLAQDDLLRKHYDVRSIVIKVNEFVQALLKDVRTIFAVVISHLAFSSHYHRLDKEMIWKKDSEGLCVLVHGFFSRPVGWNQHVAEFGHLKRNDIDLLVPPVPKIGDCPLVEAAAPILHHLCDYAQKNPGKPICIIGHSNAGRIAVWLEEQMRRELPSTPVKVTVIAGIPFGTDLKLLKLLHAGKWLFSKAWMKEADCQGEDAKQLLARVREPLSEGVASRHYEFFATLTDAVVDNIACSLPYVGKEETHYLLHGEGHFSIVRKLAKVNVESCVKWMDEVNKKMANAVAGAT